MEEDLDEGQTQKGRRGFLCKLLQKWSCFYLRNRKQSDVATWQSSQDYCPNVTFPSSPPWREKKGAAAVWCFNAFVQRARLSVPFWPSEGCELIWRGAKRLCLRGLKLSGLSWRVWGKTRGKRRAGLHHHTWIHGSNPSALTEHPESSDTQICLPVISVRRKNMPRRFFLPTIPIRKTVAGQRFIFPHSRTAATFFFAWIQESWRPQGIYVLLFLTCRLLHNLKHSCFITSRTYPSVALPLSPRATRTS